MAKSPFWELWFPLLLSFVINVKLTNVLYRYSNEVGFKEHWFKGFIPPSPPTLPAETTMASTLCSVRLVPLLRSDRSGVKITKLFLCHGCRGPGKSTYPLSANANVLSAPMLTLIFCSNVMLACYQQVGRVGSGSRNGKYVGISGKWVRWFTLTLDVVA